MRRAVVNFAFNDLPAEIDPNLSFYRGTGTDHRGRTLSEILRKSDRWLEETHDYIQWLFPLYARSKFNPHAPLLTDETRDAFTNRAGGDYSILQQNFSQTIYRMLIFKDIHSVHLHLMWFHPPVKWADKAQHWLTDGNHNFMRMTRMLRSMTLLDRGELARSFHSVLVTAAKAHPTKIGTRTVAFWNEAIQPPHTVV